MFKNYNSELISKEYVSEDVVLLKFKLDDEFNFVEGQYFMIQMENDSGDKKWKPYSVFSKPSQKDTLDLCVKIVDGGFASELFRVCEVGAKYPMRGPFGHFIFDHETSNKKHYFIGVGTGLAPLHSMLLENIDKDMEFTLLFGARYVDGLIFKDFYEQLESENSNFKYIATVTREEWDGLKGRVTEHLKGDLSNTTFYICGLKEMVLDTKAKLEELGVDSENIKFERYS